VKETLGDSGGPRDVGLVALSERQYRSLDNEHGRQYCTYDRRVCDVSQVGHTVRRRTLRTPTTLDRMPQCATSTGTHARGGSQGGMHIHPGFTYEKCRVRVGRACGPRGCGNACSQVDTPVMTAATDVLIGMHLPQSQLHQVHFAPQAPVGVVDPGQSTDHRCNITGIRPEPPSNDRQAAQR
jgi:hypothetical protein